MMRLTASAFVAMLYASTVTFAQDASIEGPGVSVSDGLVLHPSAGLSAGVNTNVFLEQSESDPVTSPIVRFLAGLDAATRPPERLGPGATPMYDFRGGLHLTYSEFLSGNPAARAQRDLGVRALANLGVNPFGKLRLRLRDSFTRSVRPRNFESEGSIDRDINEFHAGVSWLPGGGALSMSLGYDNLVDFFESQTSRFANRINHNFSAQIAWQFLPVTKFYVEGSYGIFGPLGSAAEAFKASSNPWRAKGGIATALTEMTTLKLHGGYAASSYSMGTGYGGLIAGGELGFRYAPTGRITLSYDLDYQDSINANFYRDHTVALGIRQQIRRVLAGLSGEGKLRTYQGINPSLGGEPNRDDSILQVVADANWVLNERISLNADYTFSVVNTDYLTMLGGVADDPSYLQHQVFAGMSASF